MHGLKLGGLLLLTVGLGSCGVGGSGPVAHRQAGRYSGIGTYYAGAMWQRMAADAPRDPQAATLRDDEQVIVTVDSHTGEVRQCGNLSGQCIRSNPWSGAPQPVRVTEHAEEIPEATGNVSVDVTREAAPANSH
jgi:hypothetical protein